MGGVSEDRFKEVLKLSESPDPNYRYFHKFKVKPGNYLVELYRFIGANFVNNPIFELNTEDLQQWWKGSYPGESPSGWVKDMLAEEDFDSEVLQTYLLRLTPLSETVNSPHVDSDSGCVSQFETRKPVKCPLGLNSSQYRSADSLGT